MEMHRSNCPINLLIEVVGDRWTFLILRDIIFRKKRHFNELLRQSEEKIASNILRDRLAMLEREGLITKCKSAEDAHKQKITYSLTQKSIDLLPMMMEAIVWSLKYEPVDQERYKNVITLVNSGPEGMEAFQKRLFEEHVNGLPQAGSIL